MAVHEIISNEKVQDIIDTLVANGAKLKEGFTSFHQHGALFTDEANINMFSKHKPIIRAVNFCQDFDSTKPNYLAKWWAGADGRNGVDPKMVNSYKDIPSAMDGNRNGWIYRLPTGGSSAPFRLGDFAGYYPKARIFYSDASAPAKVYKKDVDSFLVSMNAAAPNEHQLTIDDFTFGSDEGLNGLKGAYAGVVITNENGVIYARCTTNNNTNGQISVNTQNLPIGTLTIYPYLSEKFISQSSNTDIVAKAYTIPYMKPIIISIEEGSIEITLSATMMSRYMVSWNAAITNKLNEQRVFASSVGYKKQVSTNNYSDLGSKNLGNVTIPANGSISLSDTATLSLSIEDGNPTIMVDLKIGTQYSAEAFTSYGGLSPLE